ncbi:MAG: hypothetical protein HKN87_10160 [Saprospiraceae bacterium]|nr:hypothetical protein [Saprospiraceae bacterium]
MFDSLRLAKTIGPQRGIFRCWLAICIALLAPQFVFAQLYPITASIGPTQSALTPYIHEWVHPGSMLGPFQVTLIFNDLNNAPINASVRISIEGGGASIRSNPNTPTIVNLMPGALLTLDQQTLANLLAPARLSNAQQRGLGNALPEGIYTICIEAYDLARRVPISNLACNVFRLQHFDVPEWRMLQPIRELPSDAFTIGRTAIDLSSALTFSWTARHPPLMMAEYALQIYAMPKDHNLSYEQVLRSELPHFSTTTFATQYVYTAMDPPLDTNRTYLAQLSVRDPMGQYNFVNNGVGPIATFQIMAGSDDDDSEPVPDPCLDPANRPQLSLDTFTADSAYLSWRLTPSVLVDSLDLDVQAGSEWMLGTSLSIQELSFALATPGEGDHRFRLGMYCVLSDTFVYSNTVSTAPFPEMAPDGCDTTLDIQVENRTPLGVPLQIGDSVIVGDFLMVIDIMHGSGIGEGYVVTPLFNMFRPRLAVEFSELQVNEEYRMLDGVVNTVYDDADGSMLHFGDLSAIFASQNRFDDLIYDKHTIPGKIIGIDISPDGNTILTIVDELGNVSTTAYPINTSAAPDYAEILEREGYLLQGDAFVKSRYPTPTSWTDSSGTEFGRVGDAVYHASDRLDQELTTKMGELGTVTFSAHEDAHGGFDAPFGAENPGDYPTIGGNYPMSWKALRVGTSEPVYADVDGSQADTIFFETVSGFALNYSEASKISLEVPCRGEGSQEAVYAIGQRISGKDTVRGNLGGLKVAGYPLRLMTLNVIPLNGSQLPVDADKLVRDLNHIYNPAIVSWQVKILDTIQIDDLSVPLVAGKGATNQYNAELRRIGLVLKDQGLLAKGTKKSPILTIVVVPELAGEYDGYMPMRRNLGFVGANKVYAPDADGVHGFSRVVAHELGHGAFGLQHSWELYPNLVERTSDNLMDYGSGIHLTKPQWDQIHNPLPVLGFLETTEGAGGQGIVATAFEYGSYVDFKYEGDAQSFTSLSPTGRLIALPATAIASYFPSVGGDWPQGCLGGFYYQEQQFLGWWNRSNRTFLGYAQKNQELKMGELFSDFGAPHGQEVYVGLVENCAETVWSSMATTTTDELILSVLDFDKTNLIDEEIVLSKDCLGENCEGLETRYPDHPYWQGQDPLSRAIQANPCLFATLKKHKWIDYPESEWIKELKNMVALTVGVPLAMPLAAATAETLLYEAIKRKSVDVMVGFTIDATLQAAIAYHFPVDDKDISWPEAVQQINWLSSGASGLEALIELKNKWLQIFGTATISCINDGFILRDDHTFSTQDCAKGFLSAVLIDLSLKGGTYLKSKLTSISPSVFYQRLQNILGGVDPNVHAAGIPINRSTIYKICKGLYPDGVPAEILSKHLDIDEDVAERLTTAVKNDADYGDWIADGSFDRIFETGNFDKTTRQQFLLDGINNKPFVEEVVGDERLVKVWARAIDFPNVRKDIAFLNSFSKIINDATFTGPPIYIEKRFKEWIQKSHLKCRTCVNGSEPFIDDVLNNLYDFKPFLSKSGAIEVVNDIGKSTRGAEGANWVMMFTRNRQISPNAFEEIITDGRKFTADIVEDLSNGLRKYFECKSWDLSMKTLFTSGNTNFGSQFTNYLHNPNIQSLNQFGYYFNPSKWTPNALDLNAALKASSGLLKSDITTWAKYRNLFGPEVDNIVRGDKDGLVQVITNNYSKIINPL